MNAASTSMMGASRVLPGSTLRFNGSSRWLVALFGLLAVAALVIVASYLATDPARFPVREVGVLGTMDYADRDELTQSVKSHTEKGFYGLDIGSLRRSVESREWIASARVSRVWPAHISIEVEEHEPAARWNDDHLISKQLVLFKPYQLERQSADFELWSDVFRPLPQVLGVQGRHVSLLDSYRDYDQQLSAFGLSLSLLKEDERLSQTLTLSNGVVVRLGRTDTELRMGRFLDVYDRIAETSAEDTLSFDMRYSSGFALGLVNIHEK